MTANIPTKDLFLSPDERYDVWVVKAAERPELLAAWQPGENDKERASTPPLTDGCDIPSWRRHRLACDVLPSASSEAVQNIGWGSALLRRSDNLISIDISNKASWKLLREKMFSTLIVPPERRIEEIQYNEEEHQHPLPAERENRPVLIHGCTKDWKAMESCTFSRLVERFGEFQWRFSDVHAETLSLRTYQKYMTDQGVLDDAPLAVYDSQFGHTDDRSVLLQEYQVPKCFLEKDLYSLMDSIKSSNPSNSECDPLDQRPPFRWILIGPARSGTGLHIDPAGTHAWVTLVEGCKRWILFPPDTPRDSIFMQSPQIPSSIWFHYHYDTVMSSSAAVGAIEVIQRPGETVYVPAGWPHLVLNLELSVAITHNYASQYPSMQSLMDAIQNEEPEMLSRLTKAIQEHRPDLYMQITQQAS